MNFDSACIARKCAVHFMTSFSFWNWKSWGREATDSRYNANAQAMSEGMNAFRLGWKITASTAA